MSMASKTVLAATFGEALEFYDFTAYGIFAVYVARAFFPTQGEFLSLLLTIATFGIGFVTRPLGALVLGAYADRVGRKKVLTWTIWLMGIGTGAIAVLPTYDDIGIAAPLLLVLARLIQGFSAGGEVGSASLLIFEATPKSHRGFAMSWQLVSRSIALIASGVVGYALTATLSKSDASTREEKPLHWHDYAATRHAAAGAPCDHRRPLYRWHCGQPISIPLYDDLCVDDFEVASNVRNACPHLERHHWCGGRYLWWLGR
jgi:MFS family permease